MAEFEDFIKLDIRVGKIIQVLDFPEAKKPMYKLKIDFGPEIGIKNSAAGVTELYEKKDLSGKLVLGVVNLKPRQIANFISEVLTLGVSDENGKCILVVPEFPGKAVIGGKLS